MSNRYTYSKLNDLFNRRAKDRTYKVLGNGWELHKNTTGQFVVGMQRVEYKYDYTTKTFVKHNLGFVCYLTVDPDDTLEVVNQPQDNDNSFKNMMGKFFHIRVWSEKKQRTHNLRWSETRVYEDHPMHKGLKLQLSSHSVKVIHMEPDVIKATDRTAAKPVYEYANKVMEVMMLMKRMDLFDDRKKLSWQERKNALSRVEVGDMTEDAMALFAEAAYWEAEMVTQRVAASYWDYTKGGRVERDPAACKAEYEKKLVNNAKRKLTALLKERHGGFVEVTVQ